MAATAAMDFLPGRTPLHVIIEAEVQTTILRLMSKHQWKPKSTMVILKSLETQRRNPA